VAVFQPHLYSRIKNLLDEFAGCFDQADEVIISDIYASRERDDLGISSRNLVDALKHPRGKYGGNLTETAKLTIETLQAGDVLLALGAGDITKLSQEVLEALKQ
jgi:UDP-N-acetylmuramate--alanine ligase